MMNYRRLWVVLIVAVCAVIVYSVFSVDPEQALRKILAFQQSYPVLVFFILFVAYVIRPVFAVPPTPLNLLVGFMYGLPGAVVILVGTVVTTTIPFYFSRVSGSRFRQVPEIYAVDLSSPRAILAFGIAPVPVDIKSISAGLLRVVPRRFFLAILIGAIPWSVSLAAAGWSLNRYSTSSSADLSWLVAATALVSIVLLLPNIKNCSLSRYS